MASTSPFTVAVLGAGHVGAAVTNALVLLGACRRMVLFDRKKERAEGEAWDIEDGVPLLDEVEIVPTSDYSDLAGADIVVVTVGTSKMRENRLELLASNAGIIREVVDALDEVAPDAALIMTTNPVDVLTRIAMDRSARPHNLILGTGTLLESARLSPGWAASSASTRLTCTPTSSASTARVRFRCGRAPRSARCDSRISPSRAASR